MEEDRNYVYKVGDRVRFTAGSSYKPFEMDCRIVDIVGTIPTGINTTSLNYHLRPIIPTEYTKYIWYHHYSTVSDKHKLIKQYKSQKYFNSTSWHFQKIWMRNEKILWKLKQ